MPHHVPPAHLYGLPSHGSAASPSVPVDSDPGQLLRRLPDRGDKLLRDGFHELLGAAPGDETAVLAFALALAAYGSAQTGKGICFCHQASDAQEYGRLYGHGLAGLGADPGQLFAAVADAAATAKTPTPQVLTVTAAAEKDLLWTLEEAVASGAFGAVVGALTGGERLYGFAASRRLKLRVMANATPLFLIRHWSAQGATAAHGRWRVGVLPSRSETIKTGSDMPLVGPPRLLLGLERMNGRPPQQWEMEFDGTRGFHLAALLEDGPARKPDRRHRAA